MFSLTTGFYEKTPQVYSTNNAAPIAAAMKPGPAIFAAPLVPALVPVLTVGLLASVAGWLMPLAPPTIVAVEVGVVVVDTPLREAVAVVVVVVSAGAAPDVDAATTTVTAGTTTAVGLDVTVDMTVAVGKFWEGKVIP